MGTARHMQARTSYSAPFEGAHRQGGAGTGASSGIGKAIAIEMGRRGASVVVNYVGQAIAADDVVSTIGQEEGAAIAI